MCTHVIYLEENSNHVCLRKGPQLVLLFALPTTSQQHVNKRAFLHDQHVFELQRCKKYKKLH